MATGSNPVCAFGPALSKSEVVAALGAGLIIKNSVRTEYDQYTGTVPPKGKLRIGILANNEKDARELVAAFGDEYYLHSPHVELGLPHYHVNIFPEIHFWYYSE